MHFRRHVVVLLGLLLLWTTVGMGTRRFHAKLVVERKKKENKTQDDHDKSSSVLTIDICRQREGGGGEKKMALLNVYFVYMFCPRVN